jgi:Cysteine-rich CPXCG
MFIDCPYCGEPAELDLEPSEDGADQEFVEDCGVCCRPWAVRVRTDADGETTVTVERA